MVEYRERTLGYAPRTALERLRVAEALERLPTITDALASGRIAYSAVRELTRIATADTEGAWLNCALGKTVREVEALVAGRAPGDRPEDEPDRDLEPRRLRLDLSPDVYARFLAARRQLEEDCGERLSDDDVMAALCDAVLAPAEGRGPRHQIAITVCDRCDRGWQDAAGQTIELPPAAVEHAQPGCRSSRYLDVHHIVPRVHGGAHTAHSLCLLCTAHHRAVHDGRLRIHGEAPALTFEHADGRAYGTPPPTQDHADKTRLALRTLGFSLRACHRPPP